jgi:hypothetical protein
MSHRPIPDRDEKLKEVLDLAQKLCNHQRTFDALSKEYEEPVPDFVAVARKIREVSQITGHKGLIQVKL